MIRNEAVVINETGFHARPATVLVKKASSFKSSINLLVNEKKTNAKSLIGVLGLGASKGTKIIVEASGEDEQLAATELAKLIAEFKE